MAVLHMKIELGSKRRNIDRIRKLVSVAKAEGAKIVVLPASFNVGPILSKEFSSKKSRRGYCESIPGPLTETLTVLASKHEVVIVAGPIIERVGARLYKTSIVLEPLKGVIGKLRKVNVEPDKIIARPKDVDLVAELYNGIKLGLIIEDDILLPEISLALLIQKPDVVIAFLNLDHTSLKYRDYIRIRAAEIGTIAVGVGGIVAKGSTVLYAVPTIVADSNGEVIEEVKGVEEKVVFVNVSKRKSSNQDLSERLGIIKSVFKTLRPRIRTQR